MKNQTVYKYQVPIEDVFVLSMPVGAVVLTVQTQRLGQGGLAKDVAFIWALVDPVAPNQPRKFRLAGTGHPITEEIDSYIGTFQLQEGRLVFHLFEIV
jgi:hypothetical protein